MYTILFDTAKLPHEFFQGYSCAPKFGGLFCFKGHTTWHTGDKSALLRNTIFDYPILHLKTPDALMILTGEHLKSRGAVE